VEKTKKHCDAVLNVCFNRNMLVRKLRSFRAECTFGAVVYIANRKFKTTVGQVVEYRQEA